MNIRVDWCACGIAFVAKEWVDGACPHCGAEYVWDEIYDEETGDSWALLSFGKSTP